MLTAPFNQDQPVHKLLLNDLVSEDSFSLDDIYSQKVYEFKFIDPPDIGVQRVLIHERALNFMKENRHGARWLKYLLRRASKTGDSGMKPLAVDGFLGSHLQATHEIKIAGGKSSFRLAVRYDEENKMWVILREFNKDL